MPCQAQRIAAVIGAAGRGRSQPCAMRRGKLLDGAVMDGNARIRAEDAAVWPSAGSPRLTNCCYRDCACDMLYFYTSYKGCVASVYVVITAARLPRNTT